MALESMTGYGESKFSLEGVRFRFRIKSVNSKFLDIDFHLHTELLWLQTTLEELIQQKMTRGKISVELTSDSKLPVDPILNEAVVTQFESLFKKYYRKRNMQVPLETLVTLPEIFSYQNRQWELYKSRFEFYFLRSLIRTGQMRKREGKKIEQITRKRVRLLMRLNQKIDILNERLIKKKTKILRQNFITILSEKRDRIETAFATRLWSELKEEISDYYKADIVEEIDRIGLHLPEILLALDAKVSEGKKIEFYLQETLRETNTLTAKTHDSEINHLGILMKLEIDKLREQIRNIA